MEKSCLVLGFYLASWGMLRGSSFLLQKSVKYYENLIKYIIELKKEDNSIFDIDVDKYDDTNIEKILKVYEGINFVLNNKASCTLRTKIMLGVFGCIPAFDTYFKATFKKICDNKCKFNKVDKNALEIIKNFYIKHKKEIDSLSSNTYTKSFDNKAIQHYYSKSKIIDMYGFQSALGKAMYQKIQKKKRK
ncbi:hypothetical protein [Aliarcobacter butzleri]|uniref:hypothetical protein n=1 Tax=Aliarcobacter butzleri TaxID=28197 RepID=UPI003B225E82